jgi:predicted small lipoprotein YifL
MIRTTWTTVAVLTAALSLAACGDKPQEMGGSRSDAAPYTGVGKSQYQQPGWTVGDRNSWEQQLKSRAQYGMNDYTRVSSQ